MKFSHLATPSAGIKTVPCVSFYELSSVRCAGFIFRLQSVRKINIFKKWHLSLARSTNWTSPRTSMSTWRNWVSAHLGLKHELESSKKCYVNWQMPCKEVAKRRDQRVWEKKPKTRHRKTTASRPAFFFFCAEVQKEKKRWDPHERKMKNVVVADFWNLFWRHCSTFTAGPINISIQTHTNIYKLRNNWW